MPSAARKSNEKGGSNMVEDFQRYFQVNLATSEELRKQTYRIRYRVYCEEFGYEPADAFPEGYETDDFDDRSVHCLVTHRSSGTPAGCVRLVSVDDDQKMPMEIFCKDAIDHHKVASLGLARSTVCEVSRLAVDGAFRRRTGEKFSRFGGNIALDCSQREQRTFSLIAVSVLLAGFAAGELHGRTAFFCMMEPFLPRMLKRSGILVASMGEETDYHGLRAPYMATLDEILAGLGPELRDMYGAFHQHFQSEMNRTEIQTAMRLQQERQPRAPSGNPTRSQLDQTLVGLRALFSGPELQHV